jgi:hypothetical protein
LAVPIRTMGKKLPGNLPTLRIVDKKPSRASMNLAREYQNYPQSNNRLSELRSQPSSGRYFFRGDG